MPPLLLGVVQGGPERSARNWGDAVMQLSQRIGGTLLGVDTPLRVTVIVHAPGAVVPVDFSGMRTGRYSAPDRTLIVQVCLPPGPPPPGVRAYLLDLLDAAIDLAGQVAMKKKLTNEPLETLATIASQLRE